LLAGDIETNANAINTLTTQRTPIPMTAVRLTFTDPRYVYTTLT
jgi:hypothetical protein